MNTVEKLKESLSSEYDFKVTKSRNFLKLVKGDFDTYTLYVKESNLNDGFWGLNENQIIKLEKYPIDMVRLQKNLNYKLL